MCLRDMGEDEFGPSLEVILMSLMRLGVVSLCLRRKGVRLMSLGVHLMILAVGLDEDLRDEFDGDLDEFDEFGGHFPVCWREKGACLMSLGVRLMSLGAAFGTGGKR